LIRDNRCNQNFGAKEAHSEREPSKGSAFILSYEGKLPVL
jgi:hypothetical protein